MTAVGVSKKLSPVREKYDMIYETITNTLTYYLFTLSYKKKEERERLSKYYILSHI